MTKVRAALRGAAARAGGPLAAGRRRHYGGILLVRANVRIAALPSSA